MINNPSILLTRTLSDNSSFHDLIRRGCNVVGQSLIKLSPVKVDQFPETDWLFFYSKNAFKYFLLNLSPEGQLYYLDKKIGCIGKSTADYISSCIHRPVDFVGKQDVSNIGKQFKLVLAKQKVLIPRAEKSRKRIEKILDPRQYNFSIVYSNNQIDVIFDQTFDLLIFTSPLNVKSFFKNNDCGRAHILTIGNTTKQEVIKHVQEANRIIVSPQSDEYTLYRVAKKMLHTL